MDFEKATSFINKKKEEYEKKLLYKDRYFYNDTELKYFDIKGFNFKQNIDLARHLGLKPKELEDLRISGVIPTYEGLCYWDGGREGYYNLLDKSNFLKPNNNPIIHPCIDFLIKNLCNNKQENIDYILKSIIYKYTHLNDVFIPAVVFHGVGGSGKGLFMKLLGQIFGEKNTQIGLNQDNMDSKFSAYTGQKLIVEFKEISVENTIKGKRNINKLKTIIMEDKIMIEKKGQNVITVDNIAWFILSSNETKPIHLDGKDSGNRRFSIIKTGGKINNGKEIEEAVNNKENIESFLAYLFKKFPNIQNETSILALDNEDKKELEKRSETTANLFFQWFEEEYKDINLITIQEREALVFIYRNEIGDIDDYDESYKAKYFNANLSVRYELVNKIIRDKKCRGYEIKKQGRPFTNEESIKILKYIKWN